MAIAAAFEQGGSVMVYDAAGRLLASIFVGFQTGDRLMGYTSRTVSIRQGNEIRTFDQDGRLLSSVYSG
jgi:hypothetical protein